jgi:hypothetical protein
MAPFLTLCLAAWATACLAIVSFLLPMLRE